MKRRERQKQELLEHYSKREPQAFYQIDAFLNEHGGLLGPDEDGDGTTIGVTYELMYGSDVRLLIKPRTSVKDVRRVLAKIRKALKEHGFAFHIEELARQEADLEAEVCQHCGERLDVPATVSQAHGRDEDVIPF